MKSRRTHGPLLLLGLAFLGSLVVRCAGNASGLSTIASSGASSGASDGGLPSIECTPENAATTCSLPPSTCDDLFTLLYYTNPTCVGGRCQWTPQTMACPGCGGVGFCNYGCQGGACITPYNSTGVPPPSWSGSGTSGSTVDASGASNDDAGDAADGTLPGDATLPGDGAAPASDSGSSLGTSCVQDANACTLPPSVCADSQHLLYYMNARCVDGGCEADPMTLTCSLCTNGACLSNLTR